MNFSHWRKMQSTIPHEHQHRPTRIEFTLAIFIGAALIASLFSDQYWKIPRFITPLLLGLFIGVKIFHIIRKGGTLLEDYASIAVIILFAIVYYVLKTTVSPLLIAVFIAIIFYSAGLMLWVRSTFGSKKVTHFLASYLITIVMIIFLFAGAYLSRADQFIEFGQQKHILFEDALYFSTVTITTVGYGDITPLGVNRWLAALEAFLGMLINVALLGYVLSIGRSRIDNLNE